MKEDLFNGLTKEQIAKARACKNHESLLELAKEEGVELNEDQLKAIAGGGFCSGDKCPQCGHDDIALWKDYRNKDHVIIHYMCKKCKYEWSKEK